MPFTLDQHPSLNNRRVATKTLARRPRTEFREHDVNCIDIGLINNMPAAALEATEFQFRTLLDSAAHGIAVRLTVYALPDVPRTDAGRYYVDRFCSDVADLWDRRLDGLIVTGTEPHMANLLDESYWGSFTKLVEWSEYSTHSAVWSCLAAHAAVLHMDGIGRRRLPDKQFGVFGCARVSDHALTTSIPSRFQMPHSRWNEIPANALITCGYRVLTQSDDAGLDLFVKQRRNLFVFVQGHPEYEPDTLLREYRRDIGRFLRGERESYPTMPRGYFAEHAVAALTAFRERALSQRHPDLLPDFPTSFLAGKVKSPWRSTGVCIYRNWLRYLCEQKQQRLRSRPRPVEYQRARTAT